jgi:hypothetical protein
MSIRILGAALALLVFISGCHSTSRYGAAYAPPCPTPCPTPCNTCGTPPPPGTVAAVAGY